jgi:glycosyltransferase involved in cell wall biosynthesis
VDGPVASGPVDIAAPSSDRADEARASTPVERDTRSVLFVSGTSVGGANRSTHELAFALSERGHHVAVLTTIDEARWTRRVHKRLLDAAVRVGGPIGRMLHATRRRVGRRLDALADHGYPAWRSAQPENALSARLDALEPDIVVVSSVERPAWRQIRAVLAERGIASILYLRERTALGHLVQSGVAPDLVVANSEGHAREARAAGYEAIVVPSIVDLANCRTTPTRERVVFVNPVPLFGLDIALRIAEARPDIPFTFARSWPISAQAERELLEVTRRLGNVEVADPVADPRDVYAKARIVLVPYLHPGRPRVVAEAHASGIPVVGSDSDGTAEAIGPAGIVVAASAPIEEWTQAVGALWDDDDRYAEMVDVVGEWANRPEVSAGAIVAAFEECMGLAIASRSR